MSYQDRDESVEDGNPLLLFKFVQGASVYRYALACDPVYVSSDGLTWTPAIVSPGEFGRTNEVGKDSIRLDIADDDPIAETFASSTPDQITTLTVFRMFTNPDTEMRYYWKGRVTGAGREPGRTVLNCDPIFSQLQRPGLRAMCTKMCRHVLYGRGCNLQASNFEYECTVRETTGSQWLALPPNTAHDGYWDGGYLKAPDGTARMIVRHQGGKLLLIRPIKSLVEYVAANPETGATVSLFRGCDRSFQMCKERFGNGGNFGGFPWFAEKNPFSTRVSIT